MLRVSLQHVARVEAGCCVAFKLGHHRHLPRPDLRRLQSSAAAGGSSLLPKADDFAERHIGPRRHDQQQMLSMLGFKVSHTTASTTTQQCSTHQQPSLTSPQDPHPSSLPPTSLLLPSPHPKPDTRLCWSLIFPYTAMHVC